MHILRLLACLCLAAAIPSAVPATPQQTGPLLTRGGAVVAVARCGPGLEFADSCRAIDVIRGGKVDRLGEGYSKVTLLWRRESGANGPDLLVRGDWGGSGGVTDLYAISLEPVLAVRKLSMEYGDWVTADSAAGALSFDAPFLVRYFNGAPNSNTTTIHLPMRWVDGDFAVNLGALTARSFSPGELRFRELAVRHELSRWASDTYPSPRLFPPQANGGTPVTAHALADLMLAGRADLAKELLDRTWPRSRDGGGGQMDGKEEYWSALCRTVTGNRDYERFGLSRIPHSALIEAGAARAK